ncbi:MAG: DUF2156 domain-containing protein [Desulfomonilia bacterium]|jgi:hypothetical protein|uniref:Phosphatidylglycerol lysyltransferase C-terminal domain-containing protein n=1 Tax=anaerobic digester metagenome TaxID=1263854 RepID=A0A485M5B7_9ZZZZ|nr:phosphatidylglycerol lysyltransferase domain-containing protein [Pseudomonadota bacterium]HON39325.1 phosphatidylglycerol lysyltransferase domain-containing protein [Deltaproteobacteria bacterium]HRS57043.1 phosphatidylglycerol lysyltransferase domain-containing protein [Desulfomonilia bacterium]HPD22395.1 phosphatidylglycerol lysyltransferase domain-containing protein [Deltaproteobacteria bacterium]HPX17542.1 phosphatidylglycerol lysyltransferase domain-containing protein [Deltaproteobacter
MQRFEPISLERQDAYRQRLAASTITASDYSFINLWGWAEEYGLAWAWGDDLVWIRQSWPEEVYWAPVGPIDGVRWADALAGLSESNPVFTRVPRSITLAWEESFPGRVEVNEVRDQWDYLYSVEDLVKLSGNRYHKKKNLLNQFKKRYNYEYRDLTPDILERIIVMQERWCAWKDCESSELLAAENRVVVRLLRAWHMLRDIMGGAVFVDGEDAAFCIAERFSPDILIMHVEKGFTQYIGIYQAINQMFLAAHQEYRFVNRQQDLGEEGLRKAKLSYHPVDFVHKYRVRFL